MHAHLHIALRVQNVLRAIDFYSALFDIAPDKVASRYARFTVHDPPLILSVNEAPDKLRNDSKSRHVEHFGIRLGSRQLESSRRRLAAAGLIRKVQTRTTCCYSMQNKVWARDPDGNDWEFYELVEDFQPPTDVDTSSSANASECCP